MNMTTQRGFTLIEMVIVIVITGIIAAVVAVFMRGPVQGYLDSTARADLTDAADIALRRMARDLRLALPNSIRVSGNNVGGNNYVEFLLTSTGGRYLATGESTDPTVSPLVFGGSATSACTSTNCKFTVLAPTLMSQTIAVNDSIVVYNLGPTNATADAYSGGNRATVSQYDSASGLVTLSSNPFAMQNPTQESPGNRFQVVQSPVTYGCDNNLLTRYWGYPITLAQIAPPTTGVFRSAVLAQGVTGCIFSYSKASNISKGLISLKITMKNSNNESITLTQQVHVDNTP